MSMPRAVWLTLGWMALVGGGGAGSLWPTMASIGRLREEKTTLESRVERSDDGAAAVRRLQEELVAVRVLHERQARPIPTDSDVASLIRQLTARLDELAIREREITTGAPTAAEDVMSMPMSVTLQGEFVSVYSGLRWIESLPRMLRVQRLKIDTDKAKSLAPGEVRAELLLELFFDRRPAAAEKEKEKKGDGTVAGAAGEGGS